MRQETGPSHDAAPPRAMVAAGLAAVVALGVIAGGLATWRTPPPGVRASAPPPLARRGLPPAAPSPVLPMEMLDLTPETAREINAAIPFVPGPPAAARAFRFVGPEVDRARATACLAAAAWWEAGDDPAGQRAVVQVVLNRLRHPAYPKSVCGVVFQGSERRTGCQFTFTCDGALRRRPSAAAWDRARDIAAAALRGAVDETVGTATHYHTDWVVPYWSASLDKIARVGTHLFFRWRGAWGLRPAFTGRYAGGEPLDPRIAALAAPEALGQEPYIDFAEEEDDPVALPAIAVAGIGPRELKGNVVRLADEEAGEFGLELDAAAFPGDYAVVALNLCRGRAACVVAGWTWPQLIPARTPMPRRSLQRATFIFRRAGGREQPWWNCRQVPRARPAECLPGTEPPPGRAAQDDAAETAASAPAR